MKQTYEVRRIQQSSKDSSLEVNLPKSFQRIGGLQKGDLLKCQIMTLKDNRNVLILEKLEVTT